MPRHASPCPARRPRSRASALQHALRGARARRFTTQTTQVGDYLVPPGVFVYVLFHRQHNNAKYWHQPDVFRPERWDAPGPSEPAEHRDKVPGGEHAGGAQHVDSASSSDEAKVYLPFSEGSRSCVAQACTASLCCSPEVLWQHVVSISASLNLLQQNLALMELRVALVVLCSNFTFELAAAMGASEGAQSREMMALTLHMRGGVWMHCIPRV